MGGFITVGDVILEIVPTGDDLIVEGRIDPKDIAYIQPDQKVRISLTGFMMPQDMEQSMEKFLKFQLMQLKINLLD